MCKFMILAHGRESHKPAFWITDLSRQLVANNHFKTWNRLICLYFVIQKGSSICNLLPHTWFMVANLQNAYSKFPDYSSHLILMFSLQESPIVAISLTDYPGYTGYEGIFREHLLAAGGKAKPWNDVEIWRWGLGAWLWVCGCLWGSTRKQHKLLYPQVSFVCLIMCKSVKSFQKYRNVQNASQ